MRELLFVALLVFAAPVEAQRPGGGDIIGVMMRSAPPVRVGLAATLGPGLVVAPFDPAPEVGLTAAAAGLVLGPAAGYAYAGDLGGAVPGLLWRSGAAGVSYLYLDWVSDEVREAGLAGLVLAGFALAPAAIGWGVLVAIDLARLERRWNDQRARPRFAVAPWVHGRGGGLQLRLAF
jgi:hypothetical protein